MSYGVCISWYIKAFCSFRSVLQQKICANFFSFDFSALPSAGTTLSSILRLTSCIYLSCSGLVWRHIWILDMQMYRPSFLLHSHIWYVRMLLWMHLPTLCNVQLTLLMVSDILPHLRMYLCIGTSVRCLHITLDISLLKPIPFVSREIWSFYFSTLATNVESFLALDIRIHFLLHVPLIIVFASPLFHP